MKIAAGRRADDGRLRVFIFADGLLGLATEGLGERVPTMLLTLDQANKLRDALAELIPLLAEASGPEELMPRAETKGWQGAERRLANR
ncbi:MAG TPA: hypothetical protein VGX92_00555 [Pyrinomonadaceae bacterium]|nr:hypothetical protein [Pyrinomonadaceae bacterium]